LYNEENANTEKKTYKNKNTNTLYLNEIVKSKSQTNVKVPDAENISVCVIFILTNGVTFASIGTFGLLKGYFWLTPFL